MAGQAQAARIGARRGQALLLAVIVLLMLALMGGAVVALLAGQVKDTATDEQRAQALWLARAGLKYAEEQLNSSVEGADWRPTVPDYADPANANYNAVAYNNTYDSFEKLQRWDPAQSGAPYYAKIRFGQDPDARTGGLDPNQDFSDGASALQPVENTETSVPLDHFLLRVEYAPDPSNAFSKYLKITSIGRPGANINAFKKLVAYKAMGIQDYLWFVHDRTRSASNANLGVPGLDVGGTGTNQTNNRSLYAGGATWSTSGLNSFIPLTLNGPVRSNANLLVSPPVAVNSAGNGWVESLETSGSLTLSATGGQAGGNAELLVTTSGGSLASFGVGAAAQKVNVGTDRLEAPAIDVFEAGTGVARFDRLTRFSGDDVATYPTGAAPAVTRNSGELGYGRGIFIDNTTQRDQFDAIRNTWLAPETWGGRQYVPNGVLIELYDSFALPAGNGPAIVVTRTDGSTWYNPISGLKTGGRTMVYQWPTRPASGAWSMGSWSPGQDLPTAFPQPCNGVIVADGNVRIRGRLPVSTSTNNYHLTVVSRGSVYVDGPLLRPSDYGAAPATAFDTRIALLARDYVVVNPTALAPGRVPGVSPGKFTSPTQTRVDAHFVLDPAGQQTIGASLPTPSDLSNLYACAEIAGNDGGDNNNARAAVALATSSAQLTSPATTSAAPWLLNDTGGNLPSIPGAVTRPNTYTVTNGVGVPVFLADWGNLAQLVYRSTTSAPSPDLEYTPDLWAAVAAQFNAGTGLTNWLTVQPSSGSQSDVLLKNLKLERLPGANSVRPGVDLVVSALMFAERGSFFVIPGDNFDPRANLQTDVKQFSGTPTGTELDTAAWRLARLKRFNYRVVLNGAISMNNAPSLTEVGQWTDKWCYPTSGAGQTLFNDYAAIVYNYDWGLRTAVANRALLPDLPASPGLVYSGEDN